MNESCQHHRGLCSRAYRDDDPDRCPWCHRSWSLIVRSGRHSCEEARVWPSEVAKQRTSEGRRMRLDASSRAQDPRQTNAEPLRALRDPQEAVRSDRRLLRTGARDRA